MDNNYFMENEKTDFQLLEAFNEKTNLFKNLGQLEKYSMIDASGITDDCHLSIELKRRNQILQGKKISGCTPQGKDYITDSLMVEAHKLADLLLEYIMYRRCPLYVNFLADGSTIIFNLAKLNKRPLKKNYQNIFSKGYERKENGDRFLLSLDDAIIYNKEGKKLYDRQG